MNDYLPFIIFGLTTGSVYGIAAMGLVLTYKTTGIFNFGHGAIGAAAAYVFYALRDESGTPWPVAALVAVGVFGVLAGYLLERFAAVLAGVPTSYKIVGTVGLLLFVRGLAVVIFGAEAKPFPAVLSQHVVFTISDVAITVESLIIFLLGVGSAAALYLVFTRTRFGTAMRGVVDNPTLVNMSGQNPVTVRRRAWLIGSCFAAMSGVLFASLQQQLDATILSLLVIQAFGAAAIARFTSLPMAFVGGLIIGVLQKVLSKVVATHENLQGLDLNMPFIVLFAVLLFTASGKLREVGVPVKAKAMKPMSFASPTARTLVVAVAVTSLLIPSMVGARLPLWNEAMTQVVLFLSLGLLVRTSGQISLCHVGFAAIGAAGFGHMIEQGVPWGFAVLIGALIAVPVGALIAIPAIRLSGLYLGLATLGFGVLLANYAYNKEWMFGSNNLETARPEALGLDSDKRFFYLLWAIAAAAVLVVVLVERSRMGRLLRGVADSPLALSTLGTNVSVVRVMVFCLSAFLAGVSGATYASLFGSTNGDSYPYINSLIVLAVLTISGRSTVVAALVAPLLLRVVPGYVEDQTFSELLQVGFGAAAMIAALASGGAFRRFAEARATRLSWRTVGPHSVRIASATPHRV
jgi:ABC-type branched-subunit amino acid transport system permease subunit